ncbi:jg5113 [Pararge aegeria aegeria]|uniref:Jg5113 protein n=1 Tax=Pararge aegeria aegeria TaxID=348720 RepID=A0A8S4S859_9NEOP|nr:jg5113 [Pararge aegeria aegeria]
MFSFTVEASDILIAKNAQNYEKLEVRAGIRTRPLEGEVLSTGLSPPYPCLLFGYYYNPGADARRVDKTVKEDTILSFPVGDKT